MRRYLLYAIGEVALVMIGILLALQVNNWNENRKATEIEIQYMRNLLIDLAKDRLVLENNIDFGPIPVIYNDSLYYELQKRPLQGHEKRIYHFLLLYTNGIDIIYHDRIISELRNSGGFGLIRNQKISDAILDYDIYMRETRRYIESSRIVELINHEIQHHHRVFEMHKVAHLKKKAIELRTQMDKINYPDNLKLLSYDEMDIQVLLNSLSSVREIDDNNYTRSVEALSMNQKLDALIRTEYKLTASQ